MAEEDLIQVRRGKAAALREMGVHPYGAAVPVRHTVADLLAAAPCVEDLPSEPEIQDNDQTFQIAGRALAIRRFGKGAFLEIRDRSLRETQIFLSKAHLSGHDWRVLDLTDVGDHVRAEGRQFRTRRGDRALRASSFTVLTKAQRPLPEKWHGLTDKELRYRQRYLDLVANEQVRRTFVLRSRAVSFMRRFLDERGFMEVETPMMHSLVSGAAARPFVTHHNALDIDLYMRIAPELYLKRLVVGGFERVYEIGRNFRNEGLSPRHNPEFTMLELYFAHATWHDLMNLTEEMMVGLVHELGVGARDDPLKVSYQGEVIDFSPPWPRVTMRQAILERVEGLAEKDLADAECLRKAALRYAAGDDVKEKAVGRMDHGELVGFLFEEAVEASLQRPTFITGFPVSVSPLARRNDEDPSIADRFELIIAGREIANAFNELGDPDDQRSRLEAQVAAKEAGAEETMDFDADYIRALEHGLPPTAGEGIGVDRLLMLFADAASIRDVILFPLMRPLE